nr:hypothetical protein [Streptomyces sp. AgN23]
MTAPTGDGISRRGVIGTAAAVGAGGWPAGSGTAWAAPQVSGGAAALPERMVRAAAPRWRRMPGDWKDGPFLANGLLGAVVYKGATPNSVKVMLSHTQVQDQRPQWRAPYGFSRLPIGHFDLTLAGEVTGIDWMLDLWDAELRGTVTTTRGSVRFTMLVHNARSALLISTRPSAGEEAAAWSFTWMPAASPRTKDKPADYTGNPDPRTGSAGDTHYVEQPLIAGGGWTTAWRERRVGTGRLLAAHIVYRHPEDLSHTTQLAVAEVARTLATDPDDLVRSHRAWWHRFYQHSLVSVPDKRLQSFYWIQLYKVACATRADGPSMSEWGPWYPETGGSWTAVWWNLNVQIATWLVQGSNHLELDSVTSTFKEFEKNLPLSVPPEYRDGDTYALAHPSDWLLRPGDKTVGVPGTATKTDNNGNLIWAMHNVWLSYRHTMDIRIVRDVLYPILAKAVNFYDHFLHEGGDGKLHLPLTRSPEWADAEDCTYDLSLLRWGCATLLDCLRILRTDHPRARRWREILNRLVAYPPRCHRHHDRRRQAAHRVPPPLLPYALALPAARAGLGPPGRPGHHADHLRPLGQGPQPVGRLQLRRRLLHGLAHGTGRGGPRLPHLPHGRQPDQERLDHPEHHVRRGRQPRHRKPPDRGPVDPRNGRPEPQRRPAGLPLRLPPLARPLGPLAAHPGRLPRGRRPLGRAHPLDTRPQRGRCPARPAPWHPRPDRRP